MVLFLQTIMKSQRSSNDRIKCMLKVMRSPVMLTCFHAMSCQYRSEFITSIVKLYDLMNDDSQDYYTQLCNELTKQPYCFYFFIIFIEMFTNDQHTNM